MSAQEFPISLVKAFIGTGFNGTVFQAFLWGIYTVVYLNTLYTYLSKKASRNWVIIGAISVSYVAYSVYAIVGWYLAQKVFIDDSDTRDTLFESMISGSEWPTFVTDVVVCVMALVADGILIWRCFHVWGRSVRAILLPAFFVFCMDVTVIIYQGPVGHFELTGRQAILFNELDGTQAFTTFAATLTSTVIIAYRIYTAGVASEGTPRKSRRLLKNIVEILLQSSAVYSVTALLYAVFVVVPQSLENITWIYPAQSYLTTLFLFASGVAPAAVVARVASLDDGTSGPSTVTTMRILGLQFNVQSTAHGGSQVPAHRDDSDMEIADPSELSRLSGKEGRDGLQGAESSRL